MLAPGNGRALVKTLDGVSDADIAGVGTSPRASRWSMSWTRIFALSGITISPTPMLWLLLSRQSRIRVRLAARRTRSTMQTPHSRQLGAGGCCLAWRGAMATGDALA